jgi:hypothetical protein
MVGYFLGFKQKGMFLPLWVFDLTSFWGLPASDHQSSLSESGRRGRSFVEKENDPIWAFSLCVPQNNPTSIN